MSNLRKARPLMVSEVSSSALKEAGLLWQLSGLV